MKKANGLIALTTFVGMSALAGTALATRNLHGIMLSDHPENGPWRYCDGTSVTNPDARARGYDSGGVKICEAGPSYGTTINATCTGATVHRAVLTCSGTPTFSAYSTNWTDIKQTSLGCSQNLRNPTSGGSYVCGDWSFKAQSSGSDD